MAHIRCPSVATRYYMVHYCNVLCAVLQHFLGVATGNPGLTSLWKYYCYSAVSIATRDLFVLIRTVIVQLRLSGARTFKCSSRVVFILHIVNKGVFDVSTGINMDCDVG